jgi:hypothetical protein
MNLTRNRRYPVWSSKVVVLISIPVIVTITLLVFALSNRSVFVESQITLAIISLCLFACLTIGLYQGVRLERPGKDELERSVQQFEAERGKANPRWFDFLNFLFAIGPPDPLHVQLPHVDLPHLDLAGGSDSGGDDLVGCLVTLVVWIGVMLLIVLLVWLLAQAIAALPVIVVMLYWVFYRALRVVFARSRSCRGRLLRSMGYGLLYTVLYTGWIFALLWVGRFLLSLA